ncbi:hypothetical protein BJ138DRAFT_1021520 [Hygrophoropsis aurantiaca]|uniref:Uncharacterized protein n=1 Tax=Hygrophoropsis aurantiaca TaxID=72124 RepID=A0ACB7ZPN4_9AGAM|nr:hypothetical protein BJ138DRAFT_1021520 [Hygrophoropsis aurantiaca]
MTAQSNDAMDKYWVYSDEYKLRKKGAGRGIHRSDVICSTVGHMADAGQSLEYGKNYEGYWNGEMFVKQVRNIQTPFHNARRLAEKIIPTFERVHGAGYQALFLIDNSQGHSAYAQDSLLTSRMNVNPGGKQALMRNGWYIRNSDGTRIEHPMVFPPNHPQFPNEAKGIKVVLTKRGWSLVHFLAKIHCELNFIEFFWGKVKKYLQDNCDGAFETLKNNIPIALQSVQLSTIRLWEHQMHRWMDTYRSGLGTKDAQFQVRTFSSTQYKSHRCVPETLARIFD